MSAAAGKCETKLLQRASIAYVVSTGADIPALRSVGFPAPASCRSSAILSCCGVGAILLHRVWAMISAVALDSVIPSLFTGLCRAGFLVPVLVCGAVISIVRLYFVNMDLGVVDYFLGEIGIPRIPWWISAYWVKNSVIFTTAWNGVGFNMPLLSVGLQSIPQSSTRRGASAGRIGGPAFAKSRPRCFP